LPSTSPGQMLSLPSTDINGLAGGTLPAVDRRPRRSSLGSPGRAHAISMLTDAPDGSSPSRPRPSRRLRGCGHPARGSEGLEAGACSVKVGGEAFFGTPQSGGSLSPAVVIQHPVTQNGFVAAVLLNVCQEREAPRPRTAIRHAWRESSAFVLPRGPIKRRLCWNAIAHPLLPTQLLRLAQSTQRAICPKEPVSIVGPATIDQPRHVPLAEKSQTVPNRSPIVRETRGNGAEIRCPLASQRKTLANAAVGQECNSRICNHTRTHNSCAYCGLRSRRGHFRHLTQPRGVFGLGRRTSSMSRGRAHFCCSVTSPRRLTGARPQCQPRHGKPHLFQQSVSGCLTSHRRIGSRA
jgi:hypothetical protein